MLTTHGITARMSRTGNCWDNACVESFFGTLKRELVYHHHYATRDKAKQDIFEYIEKFYNRMRRHSTLGYHSPDKYEARAAEQSRNQVSMELGECWSARQADSLIPDNPFPAQSLINNLSLIAC